MSSKPLRINDESQHGLFGHPEMAVNQLRPWSLSPAGEGLVPGSKARPREPGLRNRHRSCCVCSLQCPANLRRSSCAPTNGSPPMLPTAMSTRPLLNREGLSLQRAVVRPETSWWSSEMEIHPV